jgi:hypothetical protein
VTSSSPSQVHAELVVAAKRIIADHWPKPDRTCPVCKVPDCEAIAAAIRYLDEFSGPPAPLRRRQRDDQLSLRPGSDSGLGDHGPRPQ